ncbi:MAG: FG-GAP-like repeat-containing protein, partial [Planctomycetota bacterium]
MSNAPFPTDRRAVVLTIVLTAAACLKPAVPAPGAEPPWRSPNNYRLLLNVDSRGVSRSNSPAAVEIDFARALSDQGISGTFDEHTIEVIAYDGSGVPRVFDASRAGYERYLLPWRLEKSYAVDKVTLRFVLPDETCKTLAVYFDTVQSCLGRPRRYGGLVGDGDFFRQGYQRRAIGAHHFGTFGDLDGDGDLDLFTGGVEPFVYCHENVGDNRLVDRGRLTSAGKLLTLPKNDGNNRSWVVPHFCDWDRDGDQDFLPSFMDGPYARKIAFFENTTPPGGQLTLVDRGVLKTVSGTPVAGAKKAGVWFPSVAFVEDFDGDRDGRTDLLLGYNNRCYLHRNLGPDGSGGWRLGEAVAVKAAGKEIELFNPCFDAADVDGDGDWDLFGAAQSGQVYLYENVDDTKSRARPTFAEGTVVAYGGKFLVAGGHPRVTVADFTGDGLLDLVVDRAWGLVDLDNVSGKREFGAMLKNVGTATSPKWQKTGADGGAPFTETFQICDAVRQNVVRAVDWDNNGRTDLLAGDCDGFVWYFRNRTNHLFPVFEKGERLSAGGEPLSLADSSGHARHDICDWN